MQMRIKMLEGRHLTAHDKKMIRYGIESRVYETGHTIVSPRKTMEIKKYLPEEWQNTGLAHDPDIFAIKMLADGRVQKYVVKAE